MKFYVFLPHFGNSEYTHDCYCLSVRVDVNVKAVVSWIFIKENKKTRFYQESVQEKKKKKKAPSRPRKRSRKKEKR